LEATTAGTPISGVVEGIVDEAIVRSLLATVRRPISTVYVQHGKPRLLSKLSGFNSAATFSPWLVIVDLNGDAECAPEFVRNHMPSPAPQMLFRVAVRQAETWLMGDRERLAAYLRVSQSRIPFSPEDELDAKASMVNIARRSRDRTIRDDMVPTARSGRKTGANYAGRLIEFATREWRPEKAAECVDSLSRCLRRLTVSKDPGGSGAR
jgi:hypothetical protein